MLAYDQSRVLLTHEDKEVYVNANRVKVAAADREYILTQGGWDVNIQIDNVIPPPPPPPVNIQIDNLLLQDHLTAQWTTSG